MDGLVEFQLAHKSKIYLTREIKAIALLGDKPKFQYEILIEFTLKNQKTHQRLLA
jgi:hypothetical protein